MLLVVDFFLVSMLCTGLISHLRRDFRARPVLALALLWLVRRTVSVLHAPAPQCAADPHSAVAFTAAVGAVISLSVGRVQLVALVAARAVPAVLLAARVAVQGVLLVCTSILLGFSRRQPNVLMS